MRAFIAVELPHQVRVVLHALQRELAQATTDVKWVEQENLHVTMRFFGDMSDEQRQGIEQALARIAAQTPAIQMQLSQLGTFPTEPAPSSLARKCRTMPIVRPNKPAMRVIWMGIEQGAKELVRLAELLEREVRTLGIPEDENTFVAHVTLGRVRFPKPRPEPFARIHECAWTPPPPCLLTHLTLFQSTLSSAGPTYTALAKVPLRIV